MTEENPTLVVIGHVESPLTDHRLAPKQGSEGSLDVWLIFRDSVREALADLKEGDDVIVLTWLDRADRDTLRVHPRDDPSRPLTGVFRTRSADRPNPIGLHRVRIISGACRSRGGSFVVPVEKGERRWDRRNRPLSQHPFRRRGSGPDAS